MELNKDLYIDGVSDYLEQQENLYNSSTDTTNSYINSEGEVISLSTWRVTDYIPVTPGSTFYYEGLINTGVAPMSAFYNSSKQFISSFKQVQGINNITIPSGARYIRFSLNNSDINLFKFDNRRYYGKYASKNYLENGKNLWNYNATNKIVGVTSTYNNSTLTLNGTATGEASNISHTNMVYLNAGTYTFKIVKESGSATGSQAIIFKNYTTNTTILNTTLNLSSGNTFTFTLENSAWVSLAIYFFNSNVFTNLKLDIQIEEGSSATPYEEYYGKYLNKADIIKNGIEDYSTNETRIGTWIDGKPLYRRVFTGTLSSGTYRNITSSRNINKIIDAKGYFLSDNVGYTLGKTIYSGESDLKSATRVIVLNNNLRLDADYSKFGAATYEIAVEYTKTTD